MGLKNSKPYLIPPKERKSKPSALLPAEEINSKPSLLLPEDIIEDILSRLPAKSLLKFRCVSKSWRSLIDSKRFIKTHRQNSFPHGIKFISNHASRLMQCSVMADPYAYLLPFNDLINNHLTKGRVAGCCNGLLCILKKEYFFLWNPATRISLKLPKLKNVIHKYGLGWDERSGAYKLFAVVSNRNQRIGKVYCSETNSWKTVKHGSCPALYDRAGVFAGGKIYWINGSRDGIESFDLEREEFGRIDLPCKLGGGWPWLTAIGERLTLWVSKGTFLNVWVMIMKEESWVWSTKNQNHIPLIYTSQGYFYVESLVSPLTILT